MATRRKKRVAPRRRGKKPSAKKIVREYTREGTAAAKSGECEEAYRAFTALRWTGLRGSGRGLAKIKRAFVSKCLRTNDRTAAPSSAPTRYTVEDEHPGYPGTEFQGFRRRRRFLKRRQR